MSISRSTLGVASEFIVAGELGRRNIYAQPTFGHQKRTDLLIFGEKNRLLKLEVKGKQGREWPNCRGIFGKNVILVFVDFAGKEEMDRPDFYILTVADWVAFAKREIAKHPNKKIELDKENVPVWHGEINRNGQPYRGMGVRPEQIIKCKEQWSKITGVVGAVP
ncbi:MAG: hypothetical protein NT028_06840 [candidate division Zixibacteria bacterium]|nr:hypothetical protein [candidate division Zixibacteria bacterium]